MRSVYLVLVVIGMTQAAVQQRSPVYPSTSTMGVSPSSTPKSSLVPSQSAPSPPVTPTHNTLPVAQAREGSGAAGGVSVADSSIQANAPGGAHSQNYLVYYYPEYRNVPTQSGAPTAVQPTAEGGGIWSWSGWRDVGYGGSALALVLVGGGLVYNVVGAPVKARALRELKDLKVEDATRVARSVLKAIERFRDLNMN